MLEGVGLQEKCCTRYVQRSEKAVFPACFEDIVSREKLVNFLWIPATAASALFTGYAYYKGYVAPGRISAEREARRRARSRTRVTVTPALGPDLVGAGLELTF